MTKTSVTVALLVASLLTAPRVFAVATFFGCTGQAGLASSLYRIDPLTGAGTLVGPMGMDECSALAIDPVTGVLYAAGRDPITSDISLYTVDVSTGIATIVGPTGAGNRVADMKFRPSDDQLFEYLEANDQLGIADKTDGSTVVLGDTQTSCCGNGMAFDSSDVLFHANDFELHTLNQTAAVATLVAELTFPPVPCSDPRINAMDFDASGTLYGVLNCGDIQYLTTVNTFTGVVTAIGPTVLRLDGLAATKICGNGVLDPGETCDEGGSTASGCCVNCQLKLAGSSCLSDGNVCTADTCDEVGTCHHDPAPGPCTDGNACTSGDTCNAGVCVGGPAVVCDTCQVCNQSTGCQVGARTDCRAVIVSQASQLALRNGTPADGDMLVWKWRKGTATDFADLGDPLNTTETTFCVFDRLGGADHLVLSSTAPPGTGWRPNGTQGYALKNPTGTPQGLTGITMRAGAAGRSRMLVKGRGVNLGLTLPPLGLTIPVTAQLQVKGGTCWGAAYGAHVGANGAVQFRASSD
jgi:hypothetical protein